jgi:hypothetical protein
MSRWYRAYEGTVTDAKLAEVALSAETSRSVVIACWHAVLENAASLNDGGRIELPARRVAAILCEPVAVIERVFAEFRAVGLLDDSGVCAWRRRQFDSDTSTERSRKHREAKRNADATLQNADASPPETETETEEDYKAIALSSADPDVAEAMVEIYHEIGAGIWPKVGKLSPSRKAHARQRLKDCGGTLADWRRAMTRARASPFLTGANASGWRAGFDFFMRDSSFTKLLEGSYDARSPSGNYPAGRPRSGADLALDVGNELLGQGRGFDGWGADLAPSIDAERNAAGLYRVPDRMA